MRVIIVVGSMNALTTQVDIIKLMSVLDNFHDTILHRIIILNTEFVDHNGHTHLDSSGFTFDALFLFQKYKNYVIEILFEKVIKFNLRPSEPNYSSQFLSARMRIKDGIIFLAMDVNESLDENWVPDNSVFELTWIAANKAYWRFANDDLGSHISPPFQRRLEEY